MAPVAQISDLNSNEIEWLANHLGHNVHNIDDLLLFPVKQGNS